MLHSAVVLFIELEVVLLHVTARVYNLDLFLVLGAIFRSVLFCRRPLSNDELELILRPFNTASSVNQCYSDESARDCCISLDSAKVRATYTGL